MWSPGTKRLAPANNMIGLLETARSKQPGGIACQNGPLVDGDHQQGRRAFFAPDHRVAPGVR